SASAGEQPGPALPSSRPTHRRPCGYARAGRLPVHHTTPHPPVPRSISKWSVTARFITTAGSQVLRRPSHPGIWAWASFQTWSTATRGALQPRGGHGLYLLKSKPVFVYNFFDVERTHFGPAWDRVTRSMLDGIKIIERVAARGATFKALDRKWLDL